MLFLAFEGVDGCGKSTLINKFANFLASQGEEYILSREPGGSFIGDELREILLRNSENEPAPRTELLLYEAIRSENVEKTILPALKDKKWVLCDRYSASTVAFQCGGRGLDHQIITQLNDYATAKLDPHFWVLIKLDIDQAQKRIAKREDQEKDRFEREDFDFHKRVGGEYDRMSQGNKKWIVLDGNQSAEKVFESFLEKLIIALKNNNSDLEIKTFLDKLNEFMKTRIQSSAAESSV